MTNLEKVGAERVAELVRVAERMCAALANVKLSARVWQNYGRLRVYVSDNGASIGHIRLYDEGMEIHGDRRIRDALKAAFLCYGPPR